MNKTICDANFDKTSQLKFTESEKSTNTLLDLEYDTNDIINTLLSLKLDNYSETLMDKNNSDPPLLLVFGKLINGKEVYIKLKIREKAKNYIICVSFHYSEYKMNYPYAN
ncbi:hypothetical protein [uncultured Eubacterium sp.]|uniref:hypothetical protein n=1 Tax=uncultured Eubacterium sp. TaxID=165185 RepID=UPI0025873C3D|nr:hypothetical protein [uncultured Eubacterium sp.]